MRYFTGFIISVISILILASAADAQILKKLKNKAKKATEDKVEQKIDQEIEKKAEQMVENSWDLFFGTEYDESGNPKKSPFTLASSANVEESYQFDVVTTMQIENIKENGKNEPPMFMNMLFNENEMYTGTRFSGEQMEGADGEVFIVYDLKNEVMVMLMDSEDGKFSFAYDWKQAEEYADKFAEMYEDEEMEEAEEIDETEYPQFKKIGTKTVSGKSCEGYESLSGDSRMEMWLTQDEDLPLYLVFRECFR